MLQLILIPALLVPAPPVPVPAQVTAAPQEAAPEAASELERVLQQTVGATGAPGALAAVCRHGAPTEVAAIGLRKAGDEAAMTAADLVHIGSDTKAMTATLMARLVDAGHLAWGDTLAERLPEVAEAAHPGFRDATLLDFLRHTSGAPANAKRWRAFGDQPLQRRRLSIAMAELGAEPAAAPGEAYLYSNLGYMVAACMAEQALGAPWEELIETWVFEPLGMGAVGFGSPGAEGEVLQPWGHSVRFGMAIPTLTDNAEALGPAGTVHLGLADWGRFVVEFTDAAAARDAAAEAARKLDADAPGPFLSNASRAQLLEVGRQDYACGWIVADVPALGGRILGHSGSNNAWYASALVLPGDDVALLVVANAAGGKVNGAVETAVRRLARGVRRDAARKK